MAEISQGTFDITIKFSADAIRKFTQLERNILSFEDLTDMWNDIVPFIRENIKQNINLGQEPDGSPWASLRPAYSQAVGRPMMVISPFSSIYQAYVTAPIIDPQPMRLLYGVAPMLPGANHPAFYDIALRFGFISGGAFPGVQVPAREWFGISEHTWQLIDGVIGLRIQHKIGENIS